MVSNRPGAFSGAPSPTMSGKWLKRGTSEALQLNAFVVLPQRERAALDDVDADRIGQAAFDGDAFDPVEGENPSPCLSRGKGQDRIAAPDLKRRQNGLGRRLVVADAVDVFDGHAEAGGGPHDGVAHGVVEQGAIAGLIEPPAAGQDERAHSAENGEQACPLADRAQRAHARASGRAVAGRTAFGRQAIVETQLSHDAFSTIQATSSEKSMPLSAAISGTSESGVMPGWVLISSR